MNYEYTTQKRLSLTGGCGSPKPYCLVLRLSLLAIGQDARAPSMHVRGIVQSWNDKGDVYFTCNSVIRT